MKKRENFPPKQLGDFFRGGRILGDVCGGNFGGTFGGNATKGVEKLFWGSVGGAVNPNKF